MFHRKFTVSTQYAIYGKPALHEHG